MKIHLSDVVIERAVTIQFFLDAVVLRLHIHKRLLECSEENRPAMIAVTLPLENEVHPELEDVFFLFVADIEVLIKFIDESGHLVRDHVVWSLRSFL